MTIKKMLLLAGIATAAMAFASPASAQAENPFWYLTGESEEEELIGGEEEALEVEAPGGEAGSPSLRLTMSNGISLGPCDYTFKSTVWNGAGGGQRSVNSMTFTTPCAPPGGCEVTAASAVGLPWSTKLVFKASVPTDEIGTKAKPMTFSFTLGNGCGTLKGSTVTATADNPVPAEHVGGGCFKFNKVGNFILSANPLTATIDGEECRENTGKPVIPNV